MNCISINPNVEGTIFYLLFSVETVGDITVYTLTRDHLSALLMDFLPDNVQIFRHKQHGFSKYDDRVHTEEGKYLCDIFYAELIKHKEEEKARIKAWWESKK